MALTGELVTERFDFDGGRQVTAYVPTSSAEAVVFAGDGGAAPQWAAVLEAASVPTLMIGVHAVPDETLRLHEYSPAFDPERFATHERFVLDDVRRWAASRFGAALPAERTATFGVSAGGELALALALRNPDVFGTVFCALPGAGYRPTVPLPGAVPRAYVVAGTREPFFAGNATRWADALRDAGGDVVSVSRDGAHGDAFAHEELPRMLTWAFGR